MIDRELAAFAAKRKNTRSILHCGLCDIPGLSPRMSSAIPQRTLPKIGKAKKAVKIKMVHRACSLVLIFRKAKHFGKYEAV